MKTESEIKGKIEKQEKEKKYFKVFKPVVDIKKCTGCGLCVTVCPRSAIIMQDNKPKIDLAKCDACLICLRECPEAAIKEEKI